MVRQPTSRPAYPHPPTHTYTPTYRQPPHHTEADTKFISLQCDGPAWWTDWLTGLAARWDVCFGRFGSIFLYIASHSNGTSRRVASRESNMHKKLTWGRATKRQKKAKNSMSVTSHTPTFVDTLTSRWTWAANKLVGKFVAAWIDNFDLVSTSTSN